MSDVVELPPGASLLVVVDHGRRRFRCSGRPRTGRPRLAAKGKDPLLITANELIYRMPTRTPEYQLVMVAPRAAMPLPVDPLWWWLFSVSLLIAFCIGGLTLQLARQRQSLNGELQGALRRGEFQVLYQPIFDLGSRHCVGPRP
ncbi:hypothetical protein QNM99_16075 [Pseudomonas sp. PCH446]